jgi:hypothetical protein
MNAGSMTTVPSNIPIRHEATMTNARTCSRWNISFPWVRINVFGTPQGNPITRLNPTHRHAVYNANKDSSFSIVTTLTGGRLVAPESD